MTKTTTKYAVAYTGMVTGSELYVSHGRGTQEIAQAAFHEDARLATRFLVQCGFRGDEDIRVVAVDITESPETLTELPTLQEGDGVVFAFKVNAGYIDGRDGRFGLSVRKPENAAQYDTHEDALVALQEWALAGAAGGCIWFNGISLVALKRTSSAPTYTVRELK